MENVDIEREAGIGSRVLMKAAQCFFFDACLSPFSGPPELYVQI